MDGIPSLLPWSLYSPTCAEKTQQTCESRQNVQLLIEIGFYRIARTVGWINRHGVSHSLQECSALSSLFIFSVNNHQYIV